MIGVDEKLYEEEYVNVYDEDTNRELNKKNKKKFCLWNFLISLVGAGFNMYFMPIPGFLLLAVSLIISFLFRKKYKVMPQLVVIVLSTTLHIFYIYITSLPGVQITY